MSRSPIPCSARAPSVRQTGGYLIEALVAVLLFSLGVMVLIGTQGTMVRHETQSKLRTQASFLASQLTGQMWADQSNFARYAISKDACTEAHAPCSQWLGAVRQTLPSGSATVTILDERRADITLSWALPNESANRHQISALIPN